MTFHSKHKIQNKTCTFIWAAFLTLALSCGHENSANGVAEEFLFRYFLELNQRGALELSAGLAEKKLQDEIALTQSVRMEPNLDLSEHRPFLDYRLVSQNENAGTVTLYYDITIETPGGELKRQVVLSAVEEAGDWKINNFDTFLKNTK